MIWTTKQATSAGWSDDVWTAVDTESELWDHSFILKLAHWDAHIPFQFVLSDIIRFAAPICSDGLHHDSLAVSGLWSASVTPECPLAAG